MLCFSTRYSRLARITNTIGRSWCAAVHSAWMEYIDEPSPERQRIGRPGSATATPSAPATPWPMPPPRPL